MKARRDHIKSRGVLYGALFLAIIYFLGSVEIQSFHNILHDSVDEIQLHSAANESSGCHQSIYHNKKEKSCEHKSHIIALKKCQFCQITIQTFHLASKSNASSFFKNVKDLESQSDSFNGGNKPLLKASRAPPSV